jgi:hypothetical protein
MIETKDKRKFFTHEKNFTPLMEFSKLFKAEISIVKVDEAEVLDLQQLAPAICDKNYHINANYKILKIKLPQKRTRKTIIKTAKKIKKYIKLKFLNHEIVSLQELRKLFKNITTACLCNHISLIRRHLENTGHIVSKIGGGKYQLL